MRASSLRDWSRGCCIGCRGQQKLQHQRTNSPEVWSWFCLHARLDGPYDAGSSTSVSFGSFEWNNFQTPVTTYMKQTSYHRTGNAKSNGNYKMLSFVADLCYVSSNYTLPYFSLVGPNRIILQLLLVMGFVRHSSAQRFRPYFWNLKLYICYLIQLNLVPAYIVIDS